jgi:hypothetical protein
MLESLRITFGQFPLERDVSDRQTEIFECNRSQNQQKMALSVTSARKMRSDMSLSSKRDNIKKMVNHEQEMNE